MPISRSSRLPFRRLHGLQAVTTLNQAVRPPRDFGTTWSNVSSLVAKLPPQYWQWKRSRRKTLKLVKAGRVPPRTDSLCALTLGDRSAIGRPSHSCPFPELTANRQKHP